MKIKKNDVVKIIRGKNRGKKGKILKIFPKKKKIIIEGVNLSVKHVKPKKERETGQRIQFPAPMDISKVMLICPHCNKPVRVSYKIISKTGDKKRKKGRKKRRRKSETGYGEE